MRTFAISLQIIGAVVAFTVSAAGAPTRYVERVVRGRGEEILLCDLDGDRLKDIALADERNVAVFYQDAGKGFSEKPDLVYDLGDQPALVWSAALGRAAHSLLVMTSEGVTELDLAQRRGPPLRRQIIRQRTVLPASLEGPSIERFPLSPQTRDSAPVILVPAGEDLQLWQFKDTWQHVQSLENTLDTTIRAQPGDPGYTRTAELTMSLGDVTGDGRDDVIVRTSFAPVCTYAIYAQTPDGLFSTEPTLTWRGEWDWSWYGWVDINRDGRVDLIHNAWLSDPWYLPGTLSGKVLVRIHIADAQSRIPTEPQQVFRKNDWMAPVPVVDVDGDGCMDLVLGHTAFDSREGFRRAFTAKQLDFTLRFHFYRSGDGFRDEADCDMDLLIHLDHHAIALTYSRRQYYEQFVNLHGDFDGDGDRDVLVRDRGDRVSVYPFLSRQDGFGKTPVASFSYSEPIDRLEVEDLNNDGISDVIMELADKAAFRVFVSRVR